MADISRILICDHQGDKLASYITARRSDLACRVCQAGDVRDADLQWADTLIGFAVPVDLTTSSIRWVHSTGAGVDGLLREPWPAGVTLTRTTGKLGERIAEYCIGYALAHAQRMLAYQQDQICRRWDPVEPRAIKDTTAVIIGTGTVGSAIATRFGGLGCYTIGISRSGYSRPEFNQVLPADGFTSIVSTAHWIIIAAPLTPETHGLIGTSVLTACKEAFLINVARGALLDTTALLTALDAGTVIGAALDVFDSEPLSSDSPLWNAPGVFITPHVAGITHVDEAGDAFLDALAARQDGRTAVTTVDPVRGY